MIQYVNDFAGWLVRSYLVFAEIDLAVAAAFLLGSAGSKTKGSIHLAMSLCAIAAASALVHFASDGTADLTPFGSIVSILSALPGLVYGLSVYGWLLGFKKRARIAWMPLVRMGGMLAVLVLIGLAVAGGTAPVGAMCGLAAMAVLGFRIAIYLQAAVMPFAAALSEIRF